MKRQPITVSNEEALAPFDPLINPKPPVLAVVEAPTPEPVAAPDTAKTVAQKGLESYLNTWNEGAAKYEHMAFNEETKALVEAIQELESFKNAGSKRPSILKNKAQAFQRFAQLGMLLMLQAETDPNVEKTFADLFQKSKPAKDR
ncbi:hypothetical protein [Pseudomonas putida]|uniref:hypothetical protein n=1 Tax=Pseudomonas putida TaxID=303 RepID=UPI000A7FF922|nr:hypothetical protein [Pseudomonas putida]